MSKTISHSDYSLIIKKWVHLGQFAGLVLLTPWFLAQRLPVECFVKWISLPYLAL